MRIVLTVTLLMAGLSSEAWAQYSCGNSQSCGSTCQNCPRHVYVQQPCNCEEQPQGMFAAPTPTGTAVGETNGVGMQGMGIHFPAFTFQFPTIQLPACMRFRREPYFMGDTASHAYVQNYSTRQMVPSAATPNPNAETPTPCGKKDNCGSACGTASRPMQNVYDDGGLPPNPERDSDSYQVSRIRQSAYMSRVPAGQRPGEPSSTLAIANPRETELREALDAANRRTAELEGQMRRLEMLIDRLATTTQQQQQQARPATIAEPAEIETLEQPEPAPVRQVQHRQLKTGSNHTLAQKLFPVLR